MSDCMAFPDTVEEFMEQYKVVDTEGIYMSKGAELVPIFRMKQWVDHLREPTKMMERKTGRWILTEKGAVTTVYKCSTCGRSIINDTGYDVYKDYPFCHCGAAMTEEQDD